MKEEMITVYVCERMGWDYFTYMSQPQWFLELIIGKLEIEAKREAKESSKVLHKIPRR